MPSSKTHQAAVQLAKQRQSRFAKRKDPIASHDRFLHAIEGQALTRRELTKPVIAELIQRNRLHIEVELGNGTKQDLGLWLVFRIWPLVDDIDWLGRAEQRLQIQPGPPGSIAGSHRVGVPIEAPVLVRIQVINERWAYSYTVARRDASHRKVQRMAGDEGLRAGERALEAAAILGNGLFFPAELG